MTLGSAWDDRDRAHGGRPEVAVGDVLPVGAAVVGLPHAARAGAEVEGLGMRGVPGNSHHAAAAVRSDAAPVDRLRTVQVQGECVP